MHRDDETSAALEGVPVDDAALGDALGAGGADVVLAQHFEHRGAGQPGDDAGRHDGQRQRRQEQMVQQVRQVAAAVDRVHAAEPGRGASVTAKTQDEQQAEPEGRHRNADQDDEGDGLVGPAELADGRDDARQQADNRAQDQRRSGKDQRCLKALHHLVEHRPVEGVGAAEIAVEQVGRAR